VLSLSFGNQNADASSTSFSLMPFHRQLEDQNQEQQQQQAEFEYTDDDVLTDDESKLFDYTSYSCNRIHEVTPVPGNYQCIFASTCNDGAGVWAPFVFCSYEWASWKVLAAIISPFMIVWLVLLFRMLGSTAEDYFSPSLEMFSMKMGLPPRFAGVTLLALGNGAEDVGEIISAITGDPRQGYQLSLGALTGSAMFITCIVSTLVILVAGGVNCRGALVRDVTALLVTVIVVYQSTADGYMSLNNIFVFLGLYASFVLLVLGADIYHRVVVLPQQPEQQLSPEDELQKRQDEKESKRFEGLSIRQVVQSCFSDLMCFHDLDKNDLLDDQVSNHSLDASQYMAGVASLHGHEAETRNVPESETGVAEEEIQQQQEQEDNEVQALPAPEGATMPASCSYDSRRQRSTDPPGHPEAELQNDWASKGVSELNHREGGTAVAPVENRDFDIMSVPSGDYSMLEEGSSMDCCVAPGSVGLPATGWRQAVTMGVLEVANHLYGNWQSIVRNEDHHAADKFFLILEYPFTVVRKLSVTVPCDHYYVRGMVGVSLALSPLWFAYFLFDHGLKVLSRKVIISFSLLWTFNILIALLILRFAPSVEGKMPMVIAAPIALYGFVMAAAWIDTIAESLVEALTFVGIVLGIPSPVLGLTLLAWGNSMGDLSTNITMARKGLANMAMTACFAGPVFSMLVGLGVGFYSLAAETGVTEREVILSPSVLTGFAFIAVNAVNIIAAGVFFGKGRITRRYAYIPLTLYTIYVITSISLQYEVHDKK